MNSKASSKAKRYSSKMKENAWKVLLAQDEFHAIDLSALKNFDFDGHSLTFIEAPTLESAREQIKNHPDIAIALIGMTLDTEAQIINFIKYLRFELANTTIRIILFSDQLGYPFDLSTMDELDIEDQKDRDDISQAKMLLALRQAMKTYLLLAKLQTKNNQAGTPSSQKLLASPSLDIVNTAPIMIWTSGTDMQCNWFSQGWLNFTGRSLSQELGSGWTEGVHPDDRDECIEAYRRHFQLRLAFKIEYRLKNADGDYRWVHESGIPRYDETGIFLGYIGSCVDVTERTKIQEALTKSQLLMQESQHIAHLGSWEWNLADNKLTWTEETVEIFSPDNKNLPPSYALFEKALHPEDRNRVKEAVRASLDNNDPFNIEFRVVSKSRGLRYVHAQAQVFRDPHGTALRMVGTVHDRTEQIRAEQEAKEAQKRLVDITAAIPGVVYQYQQSLDGTWHYNFLSQGIQDLFHVSVEEAGLDYQLLSRMIVAEDRQNHTQSIEKSAKNLSVWDHEFRINTPDGHLKWLRGRASPQMLNDGSIVWNGIMTDITRQKQSEDALRLSASVFEHAHESIVITDARFKIVDTNAAFTRETGYELEEAVGRNPRFLKSGRQNREFYREMRETILKNGYWNGELWNRKKNGQIYAVLLAISAVKNDQGEITHFVGVSSDITRLKTHHEELERMAHHDPLTGLPNRVLLADRMKQAIARAQRNYHLMAVCYLDLDGFKEINDQLGHAAGDLALIEISKRISATIRYGDTVARLGGDEFVILLLELSKNEECIAMLDRLLVSIASPITIGKDQFSVGASIGVSIFPQHAEDPDTLLRLADQAMYRAKQSGKNRYQLV